MSQYTTNIREKDIALIASGGTDSNILNSLGRTLVALRFPAAFTGATISFKVSNEADGTFLPLYDKAGTLIAITATDGAHVSLPSDLYSCRYIKIISAGAEGAARSIEAIFAI